MQVSLEVHATTPRGDENVTTRLTDVNPDASFATLRSLAQNVNSFTTNTYDHATRIEETIIDGSSDKQTPTFTIAQTTFNYPNDFNTAGAAYQGLKNYITVTYNGDGSFTSPASLLRTNKLASVEWRSDYNSGFNFYISVPSNNIPTQSFTFEVGVTEGENFKAATQTITINV